MKKILMLIAAVVVMAAPAFAQSAFSDVPSDHWAYGAVSQLEQSGMVIGYPDGEFKGKRNLTRYEFAMIVAKLLPFLKDSDIKVDSFVTKSELSDFAKKGEIPSLAGYATKADLDAIAKLAAEFKPELAQLGVDVNALNADVNSLKTKVAALEAEQQRIVITGNVNIMGKAATKVKTKIDGTEIDGADTLLDYNGREFLNGSRGASLYKDFQLDIKGKVSNNINAYMTIVAGDYIDRLNSENKGINVKPYYLYAGMDFGKYGQSNLGEMPFQINKYVYQRYNDNTYYDVKRLADGNYQVSGIDYAKDWGVVDLKAWFVRPQYDWVDTTYYTSALYSAAGASYRSFGMNEKINLMAGLQLGFDIASAKLNVLYNGSKTYTDYRDTRTKANLYGATLNIPFGSVAFDTAYFYQKAKDSDKASLFDANLALDWKGLLISAGYLQVDAGYMVPGNYEAFGSFINPDNIKGWKAAIKYQWGNCGLGIGYKDYKAKDDKVVGVYSTNDKLKYLVAGINYNTGSWGLFEFKYENIKNDDAKYNYYTLDWKKVVGQANFKLGIQRVENKIPGLAGEYKNTGNILFGQAGYTF